MVYKSGRKNSDVDFLSRASVELQSQRINNDDEGDVFLGAVNDKHMAESQQYDPELRGPSPGRSAYYGARSFFAELCRPSPSNGVLITKRRLATTTRQGFWWLPWWSP